MSTQLIKKANGLTDFIKESLPATVGSKGSISDFIGNNRRALGLSLGGAGLGAGALGLLSKDSPDLSPEENRAKLRKNLMLGASLGGLSGYGASQLWSTVDPEHPSAGLGSNLMKFLKKRTTEGAVGAAGTHWIGKKMVAHKEGLGPLQESLKDAKKSMGEILDKHLATGGKPGVAGALGTQGTWNSAGVFTPGAAAILPIPAVPPNALDPAFLASMESRVRQLSGQNGLAGRLSQKKLFRNLGLDLAPSGGEQALVDQLKRLKDPKLDNGGLALDKLLGGYDAATRKGTGHNPILREAVENEFGSALKQPLSLAGRNMRSTVGRLGIGMAAPMVLGGIGKLLGLDGSNTPTKY